MYLRTVLIILVLGLVAIFAIFNWSAFSAPTTLTLGFATVEAPLGLILLGVVGVVTALFLVYVVFLQSSTLMDSRRQARELQAQREIADRAEASRFEQLRSTMEDEIKQLQNQSAESKAAMLTRLDRTRARLAHGGGTVGQHAGGLYRRNRRSSGTSRRWKDLASMTLG